jgi:hypothetical protein
MSKAEVPEQVRLAPSKDELEAMKVYARNQMGRIGDGSLLHDPGAAAIAMASRVEVAYRAELEMLELKLRDQPENEALISRLPPLRERLSKALRDQGRLHEAMDYADTPSAVEGLQRGAEALLREDTDFTCTEGCEDPVAMVAGVPRTLPRWNPIKHKIPRHTNGQVEMVTLWKCSVCGEMNASMHYPPTRRTFERAVHKAAKGTGDADILPIAHAN